MIENISNVSFRGILSYIQTNFADFLGLPHYKQTNLAEKAVSELVKQITQSNALYFVIAEHMVLCLMW